MAALDVAAATAAQAKAPVVIQANAVRVTPGPDGTVTLPDGVSLEQISVAGRDLVIQLPNGEQIVIEDGAVYVPQLVIGGVEIPAINLASLLIGNEPQPAAGGPQSSGGNFAVAVGDIGPGIGIGNLLPPTALEFSPPEFEEVYPGVEDDEPSVIIFPDDQPVGAPNVSQTTSDAGLPGGSDEGSGSNQTSGTITFHAGDTPATVTINGVHAVPGAIIPSEHGYLEIISVNNGNSPDGFVEYIFVQTENVLHPPGSNDVFEEIFEVVVTDADGDVATGSLTINILDDFPEAHADVDSVAEHGPTVANGNVMTGTGGNDANNTDGVADFQGADDDVMVTGVAAGSSSSASGNVGTTVQGQYGTLVINANGSYTYTLNPNHSAVNALDTGETLTDVFTYTITDADSDTSSTQLTITINGANDAPVANPDTNWVLDVTTGPTATTSGNVLQSINHPGAPSGSFADVADTDVDVEPLTVTTTGSFVGTYGTLQLNADGSYTYTLNADNAAVNGLDTGETLTETFNYTASDGTASANATLTITIFGTNDAPVANADTNWAQEDVAQTATGNVLQTIAHNGAPSGMFGDVADTDIDVENLTVTTTGSFTGTYGTLVLNSDGTYTYTLNNGNAAVQALDDGETLTDTFNYTASDGSATASSTLTVTIFGNNDAPVANPDTNWVLDVVEGSANATGNVLQTIAHNGAPSGTFGDVADTDVDVETLTVTTTGVFVGTYGTLTLNADGSYTYALNTDHEAVNALDTGETLTDSFNYTASDGDLSANSTLTITIFGTNDGPVANPDTNWAQEDVALTAEGNVLSTINHPGAPSGVFGDVADTDIDVETLTVTTTGDFVGTYGTLHLNADGSYTYTVNNAAVQGLDDGETVTDSFPYTATDGDLTASSTLTVTIFGNNDAPVANPDTNWVLDVVEGSANATGNVLQTIAHNGAPSGTFGDVADTDVDVETLTVTTTGVFVGTYGTLTLNADGSYTYALNTDHAAVNALDDGETLTDSFPYTASDGDLTANSTLTITIFGTNDAPVANADTNWAQEDVAQQASGNVLDTINHPGAPSGTFGDVADTDVDVENLTVTTTGVFVGTYGSLTLNADGSYTYTLDNSNPAVQALDDGETLTDSFPYTASDGSLTASSSLTVTIFGNNDAPVANPDTNWILDTNNGNPTTTGNVLQTLAHPGAPSGSFSDQADTDVDVETLTVTTTGVFVGTYGTLTLNADGSYSYELDSSNATVNALDNGETLTDSFNYTSSDGDLSANSTLTITIFGTNGAPVANADTNWAQEDVAQQATGNVLQTLAHNGAPAGVFGDVADTDVDLDTLTVTTTGSFVGTYGTLQLNADGSYTYTLDNTNPVVQALDDGETLTDSFPYTATDGDASASSSLTITIFGNNDAPVANPDTNWVREDVAQQASGNVLDTINHPGAPSGVFGDVADTDIDVENLTVTTTGVFVGTYGSLTLNADGSYTYTLDNSNPAVQALDDGETLTDSFPYTATDGDLTASSSLTVTIFGNNDAPVANPDTNWVLDVTAGADPTTSGNVLQSINHPGAPSGTFADVADTDVDVENLTVTTTGVFVGTYGTLQLNADGSYTYTLDADNAAVNALDDGETLTDSFPYTASDGDLTANATVTITIFGTNDAPVANADTNWAKEDTNQQASGNVLDTINHPGAPSGVFGDVADTDVDVENLTVTTTGVFVGTYGSLTLNADGSYTYTLDNSNPAVQALDDGETLTDSFPYTASDGSLTASSSLTVTIFGTNDAPVANPDTNWVLDVTAGADPTTTGNVLQSINHPGAPSGSFADVADTDVDVENLTVTTTGVFVGTYGTLQLNADGSYTYTLDADNAAVNALDTGETLTDSFPYTASDGDLTANSTVTITIFGTNDGPVANPDTNWAQEDVAQVANGNVLDTINHPGAPSGTFGDVADTDVDLENLTVTTTGNFVGTYGTLQLNADGSYTYTVNNAAVQGLDTGETVTDVFNYTASDGSLTASSTLTVTIFGNNDAPVANPDTNWVLDVTAGPNPTTTGNVLDTINHPGAPSGTFGDVADTDVDVESLTVTTTGNFVGTYGTLQLNADGSYTYTLNASNAAVNALDDGETLTDSFNYTASDGTASANSTVTITIFGTNDAPVVTPATVTISEEGVIGSNPDTSGSPDTTNLATNGGTLAVTDVDGESHTFTLGNPGAVLTAAGATVTWTGAGTGTLVGSANGEEVIRVTIDANGTYSVQIKEGIDHSTINVEDINSNLVIPVTVSDGTTSTNSTITVTIEDDSPVSFNPEDAVMVNDGVPGVGDAETFDLNFFEAAGADDFTVSAVFVDTNLTDNYLYNSVGGFITASDGEKIVLSGWGTDTLVGRTETSNELVVTITLDPSGTVEANDLFTVDFEMPLDDGSGVELETFSFVRAGNQSYNALNDVTGATDNHDLLFSSTKAGVQSTVNTNSTAVGVANQSMNDDETLRIDFVDNMSLQGGGNVTGYDYDAHFDINGFSFAIVQKGGSTTNGTIDIWVRVYDANNDPDTANDYTAVTNDALVNDPTTTIFVNGVEVVATFHAGKGYLVEGLSLDDVIKVTTDDGYNRIEIENGAGGTFGSQTVTAGDSFDIGQFGFDIVGEGSNQILQDITVRGTDSDGDTSTGVINITTTPVPVTPVALDLNGDGVKFVSQSAGVTFDYFDNGNAVSTAWVDANDGVLAINNDGDVDVIFSVAGSTDLEGLAANYDSNHDGVLSADDADFSKFGVLQNGEFTSLTDAGIVSLDLVSDGEGYTAANGQVTVYGEASFTRADGSTGTLADAAFAYSAAANDAQRVFSQSAGGAYANLLAAAAMITAAATGFAVADAPALNFASVQNFLGSVAVQQAETFTTQIEPNGPEIIDAFDGVVKEGPLVHDTVHFSQDLSNLLEASGFEAPQANEVLSTLLANTDMAPSLHDAAPMLVDMTVMPMIATPLQAMAQNAPAAPELVAEVLADALSGGAHNGVSIDDMLAALPSTGGGATIGLSQEFGGGAMVLAAHPMAFHYEASLVLHQDSVPVA